MGHNIEVIEGRASFFAGEGEAAWHGLGTVIEGLATSAEALELANLNWGIDLLPVYFNLADGTRCNVPDRFASVRNTDHRPLGIVGSDYTPVPNAEAFSFMDTLIDSGEAVYTTAGALQNGAKVFMTAKVGESFTVADTDEIENYLCVTTSHDGTTAFVAFTTAIRVVCQNTLTLALRGAKNRWSLTHRHTLTGRVQEARESLDISYAYRDAFQEEVDRLLAVEVTKDEFSAIVSAVLPDQKRKKGKSLEELMDIFENEETVTSGGGEGTGWAAFNAFTFWADWEKEFRSAEARYNSLTSGIVANTRNDVRNRILALA